MRLTRIHIVAIFLLLGLCQTVTSGNEKLDARNSEKRQINPSDEFLEEDNVDDLTTESNALGNNEEQSENDLPILPPIILLDFGNGTEDDNSTSEEKSKRTVNNGIGYGFERNTLHSGRHNYYFPAGKTGTTVSIEESISPFLPKTIIEKSQPTSQRDGSGRFFGSSFHQNLFRTASSELYSNNQNNLRYQYLNSEFSTKPQTTFGLRTKLEKSPTDNYFNSYQNLASTVQPTINFQSIPNSRYRNKIASSTVAPSSLEFSPTEQTRYVTASPFNSADSQRNSFNYALTNTFSRHPNVNVQSYSGQRQNIQSNINSQSFIPQSQRVVESSTVSPLNSNSHFSRHPSQVPETPKYTVENGVRYENKIFWKYPDGRISDIPPRTYETYSELPQSSELQAEKSQSPLSIYEPGSAENGVYSQGPIQFPVVPESGKQEPSPFISSESLSSSLPQQQVYRLGYQSLITQKQGGNLAEQAKANKGGTSSRTFFTTISSSSSSKPSTGTSKSNTKNQRTNYAASSYSRPQTTSKYMVNSPNPEYVSTYTTEATSKSTTTPATNLFTPSAGTNHKSSFSNKGLENYSNIQYSDLLNYNPSISQYVKDPSAILNVQPTFVQTGNSLIPVIILRVDGTSPAQPKVTPNINLKALLQQYLLQYANSIQELARPSSYDFGTETIAKSPTSSNDKNHLLDFLRFAENEGRDSSAFTADSYRGKPSYISSNLDDVNNFSGNKYGERLTARQKVKSVQIVDDPRFTTYRIKN